MKIKNAEKFREELYTAIEDALLWEFDEIQTAAASFKGGFDAYKEEMLEHFTYEWGDDFRTYKIISLPHPMMITKGDKTLYLTVDESGVEFYKSLEDQFVRTGSLDADIYKNKMSFAMKLIDNINYRLSL